MKKILFVIPLTTLMLMVTVTVTATMPTVKAQDEEEGEGGDEGECQLMDASEEGWQRRVCTNSDYDSWIKPDGTECYANEAVGSSACGNEVNNPERFITP
jgi:hypothetical protein